MSQQQQGGPFSSSCKNIVPIVRYIQPLFVETDVTNFKAVVQSLTGHHDSLLTSHSQGFEFLNNVNVVPPHSYSHAIHEIDIVAAEVEIKEMAFEVENTCMPNLVGFETETIDSFISGDFLFQNYNNYDAFELTPWTVFDQDMLWDSFLLSD